jgi:hypothetical protein
MMDPSQEVVMKGGRRLKVAQMFKTFEDKFLREGDLEYFPQTGIENWNAHELASWNESTKKFDRVDFSVEKWWENLPVFRELEREEVENRYGISVEPGKWIVCPKATRDSPGMKPEGTHGYLEVAIPTSEGRYHIFPFGKYSAKYPAGFLQHLHFYGNTVKARIVYPDENVFYSHRQHAGHPIALTSEEGANLMAKIKEDIHKGFEGNLVFQLGAENCAFWVEDILEKTVPRKPRNLYRIDILHSDLGNPLLNALFAFVRRLPRIVKNSFIRLLGVILGSWRVRTVVENGEKKRKSLYKNSIHRNRISYHPTNLLLQVQRGELEGKVFVGH